MLEVKINETLERWDGGAFRKKLVHAHTVKADTMDKVFHKVYAMRRSARYDSGRHYEFNDPSLEQEFWAWKKKNETIDMYYGGGVVD